MKEGFNLFNKKLNKQIRENKILVLEQAVNKSKLKSTSISIDDMIKDILNININYKGC